VSCGQGIVIDVLRPRGELVAAAGAQHRVDVADVPGDRVEFGAAPQARDAALRRGGHPEPLDAGP